MSTNVNTVRKRFFASVIVFSVLGLTGCDQLRQQIASLVQSKTPQESLASAQQAFTEGKFSQALEQAEPLAKKPGELQPAFALLAAQAYARMGRSDEALGMLGKALEARAVEPTALIVHPDFESMRTDVRFLALLTHHGARSSASTAPPAAAPATAPTQPAGPAPTQAKASDSVSVEIGPGGVSAKAGSVSVRLPP